MSIIISKKIIFLTLQGYKGKCNLFFECMDFYSYKTKDTSLQGEGVLFYNL